MKIRYHKPPEDHNDPYLPVKSAAGVARLNLAEIYSAIRDGRLKYVHIATGTVRVRLSDLNDYLANRDGGLVS